MIKSINCQVGGNLGGSLGPLLVALLVAPYGREHLAVFALFALAAIGVMYPICKWYKSYLNRMKEQKATVKKAVHLPLPMDKTALSIGILLILIFSKYIYMASLTSYYHPPQLSPSLPSSPSSCLLAPLPCSPTSKDLNRQEFTGTSLSHQSTRERGG